MSHKASKMSLSKQLVSVDANTTFLAHYDITANDVLKGITPTIDVSTLRPIEGYYGGGIAIEEGTTNMYPGPATQGMYMTNAYDGDYGFGAITNSQWTIDNSFQPIDSVDVQKISRIDSGIDQRLYVYWSDFIIRSGSTFAPNEERTVSFYYFGTHGKAITPYMSVTGNIALYSDKAISGNGTTSMQISVEENKWQKVTFKIKNNDATASTFTWGWMILHSDTTVVTLANTDFWKFAGVQVEKKAFDTSFVNGTRVVGDLDYNIPPMNYGNGLTISVWAKKIDNLLDTRQFINLFDSESLVLWWDFKNSSNTTSLALSDASNGSGRIDKSVTSGFFQEWNMYSLVFDGSQHRLYFNGKLVATSGIVSVAPSQINRIRFARQSSDVQPVNNLIIDELRIDRIARTESEIESWYISQLPFYPKGIYRLAY